MLMFLFLWSYGIEVLACLLASLLPQVVSIPWADRGARR
ncbi:unnamed protein product, partial [Wuchereria bancrofti]